MQIDKKNRPTRFFSKKQEESVARVCGGVRQLNSGATNMGKCDVIAGDWAIECKTKITPSESITIHKDWFKSLEADRQDEARSYAALCFSFGDGQNYYAVDEKTFKLLLSISRGEV